ncbi:MAG TPA: AAA family ATPase [Sphingomicrobium sp.]|nr:AAA family ATPase [Sphingomicrobium sp.]
MRNACAKCGFQNDERALFCESCGCALNNRCPSCGSVARAEQKFCGDCGAYLAGVSSPIARIRTPRHLAEQILGTTLSADGERKIVTLLFADIANSTLLIRDLDAEEANRILEPALDRMTEAVHRYEGTITQSAGDGVMGIFGAPIAHEDHAVRACYAALDMQEAMRAFAAEVRRKYGALLQMRVGLNSGLVVVKVRYQEGDISVDYRAVGLTTHIASRVQSLAAPGTIVLTRDTFALAKGFIRVGPFEHVTLRGIEEPIEICELTGVNTRMRIYARAARGLSKFVGRDAEMGMLANAAERAKAGKGQIVALVGEAGIGKSRVFWEFTRSAEMQGWHVLDAGSVSYGKATSYLPLVDLLVRYFEIPSRDDERRVRERISGKLLALGDETLLAHMPLFLGVLGCGHNDDTWKKLAPAERQRELFSALRELLLRESERQPLCLLFEDLHWIDAETQAFLDTLVENVAAAKILLLVNFRPEYKSRWTGKPWYSEARIERLVASNADDLLDSLLGSSADLAPIKQTLIRVTEGNPLFLEECVRSLIESGALAGGAGQWRLIAPLPSAFVPRSVQAILAARIDRLQPHLKELVQCAAVIGNDVPQALLAAVLRIPQPELERGMRELKAAEFLYEKSLFPETEYTFKHAMTREVAYASLVRERRRMLHAQVAEAILNLSDGRLDESVERLAEHAEQGQLWSVAVEYLQRAGEKAFGLYANAEAAAYFDSALKALENLPPNRAKLEQAVDLRFELRNALMPLSELGRIRDCLEKVEPLIAELGDPTRGARLASFRCNDHFLAAEQRRALQWGENGLGLARQSGDRRLEPELLQRVGQCYHVLGDHRRGAELIAQSIIATADYRDRDRFDLSVLPPVGNRAWLTVVLTELGNFGDAVDHAKRAVEIAEQARHPLSEVVGWFALGHALRRKGELDGAITALERGLALSDRHTLPLWRLRALSALGIAYAYSGRLAQGTELTRQALEGADKIRLVVDQPLLREHYARTLLLAGRNAEALVHGKRALDQALQEENRRDEPWARLLLAQAMEQPRDGIAELERALSVARCCDAKPVIAYCEGLRAVLHDRSDNANLARECATVAGRLYASLAMRPVLLEGRAEPTIAP